jgi:hypothetical protein
MNRTYYNYCIDNTIAQSNYGYENDLVSQTERKEVSNA